jgi:ubiquinone/menaquinone biosynthesis C-methylase UbiE
MESGVARYDGHAGWYDESFPPFAEDADVLVDLLGSGECALCLDVACGTGRYATTIAGAGWRVAGADISRDQLRIAGKRGSD